MRHLLRALIALFARLCRQVVGLDLFLVDGDALELQFNVAAQVLTQLTLQRAIDQHACRVVVTNVQDNERALVCAGVVLLRGSVNKRQTGKATARK